MALESISKNAATYQEAARPKQKVSAESSSVQNRKESNTLSMGTTETFAATNVLLEQQNNMNEGDQQKSDEQAHTQRLKNAITQANNKMKQTRTRCEFSYNEDVNRVSIRVLDKDTQEVIREIPPEESLEMLEKFYEITGLIVDEKR